ncbi:MAG TPA: PKD domain-containing protein [Phnomibacter sp.]|nr:PKD domain-containing protein [Phnomibacter sp.]
MQLSGTFTRRLFGLDRRVTWFMLLICLVSLGLVGYKIAGDKPCQEVVVAISSITNQRNNVFFENQVIRFSAPMNESAAVTWDFGDKSKANGAVATHMFKKEGNYPVTVTVDGRCSHTEVVVIKKLDVEKPGIDQQSSLVMELSNPISGNFAPMMGRTEIYESNVQAQSYEWSVDMEKSLPVKRTAQASFTFPRPGQYTLRLVLDGDPGRTYTRNIIVSSPPLPAAPAGGGGGAGALPPPNIVIPAPRPANPSADAPVANNQSTPGAVTDPIMQRNTPADPIPAKPANTPKVNTITLDKEQWQESLVAVLAKEMTLNDFKLYIANLDEPIVTATVNGKSEKIAFSELYNRLKNDKKIDEKSISVEPFYEGNVLTRLLVAYKRKKGLF